jgi:hypothetical protein
MTKSEVDLGCLAILFDLGTWPWSAQFPHLEVHVFNVFKNLAVLRHDLLLKVEDTAIGKGTVTSRQR